jgi:hypothetical protein
MTRKEEERDKKVARPSVESFDETGDKERQNSGFLHEPLDDCVVGSLLLTRSTWACDQRPLQMHSLAAFGGGVTPFRQPDLEISKQTISNGKGRPKHYKAGLLQRRVILSILGFSI